MKWTPELTNQLKESYEKLGLKETAQLLGLTTCQIRTKASFLGLKSIGKSKAWFEKQKQHSLLMTGRKRPEQAKVMRNLHKEGKMAWTEQRIENSSKQKKEWHKNNPHPRGALGMKHTDEVKRIMSEAGKVNYAKLTEEQKSQKVFKMMKSRELNGKFVPERNASWKGGWREIGGVRKYYRSRWEANYARYLEWQKGIGEVLEWSHEPKTFWFDGVKRGCVSYLPDFCVKMKDGSEAYHEVKGWMDDRSKTKIRRMKKYHPNVTLKVIDSKAYKVLAKQVSGMVNGWE